MSLVDFMLQEYFFDTRGMDYELGVIRNEFVQLSFCKYDFADKLNLFRGLIINDLHNGYEVKVYIGKSVYTISSPFADASPEEIYNTLILDVEKPVLTPFLFDKVKSFILPDDDFLSRCSVDIAGGFSVSEEQISIVEEILNTLSSALSSSQGYISPYADFITNKTLERKIDYLRSYLFTFLRFSFAITLLTFIFSCYSYIEHDTFLTSNQVTHMFCTFLFVPILYLLSNVVFSSWTFEDCVYVMLPFVFSSVVSLSFLEDFALCSFDAFFSYVIFWSIYFLGLKLFYCISKRVKCKKK